MDHIGIWYVDWIKLAVHGMYWWDFVYTVMNASGPWNWEFLSTPWWSHHYGKKEVRMFWCDWGHVWESTTAELSARGCPVCSPWRWQQVLSGVQEHLKQIDMIRTWLSAGEVGKCQATVNSKRFHRSEMPIIRVEFKGKMWQFPPPAAVSTDIPSTVLPLHVVASEGPTEISVHATDILHMQFYIIVIILIIIVKVRGKT